MQFVSSIIFDYDTFVGTPFQYWNLKEKSQKKLIKTEKKKLKRKAANSVGSYPLRKLSYAGVFRRILSVR